MSALTSSSVQRVHGSPRVPGQYRIGPSSVIIAVVVSALATSLAKGKTDFATDILPLVKERCAACHFGEGGEASLSLVSREAMLRGGKSGPAVVPGDPDASLVIAKISGANPAMPPVGRSLTAAEVETFRQWIADGAHSEGYETPGTQTWWSFQPLSKPKVPDGAPKWARNEIDRFVWARLDEVGLGPSAEADRATLIRRLSYNLRGLPPDPAEVDEFVNDPRGDAYERLVDRLLASPRYGERWGRHWLDVVHYGESHGYDKDKARRSSWPYRDYVIQSLNQDKPYSRFVREQLAGDVLWPSDPEGVIATGFIAAGPWDYVGHAELREGTKDKKIARLLDRDDMIATTMSTFSSLTVHCARCHDHKFDPIRQADYYALQAVFSGVDRAEQPFFDDPETHSLGRDLWFRIGDIERELLPYATILAEAKSPTIGQLDKEKHQLAEENKDLLPKVGETDTPRTVARRREIGQRIKELDAERKQLAIELMEGAVRDAYESLVASLERSRADFAALPQPSYVYSASRYFNTYGRFTPAWTARPVHLLGKGSVEAPLSQAHPGAVSAVPGLTARFELDRSAGEGAARAALAAWLTDSSNPLTWRSIVNRVWHYHFGRGIVDSPNDFGKMGGVPTHPDLLDWLAVDFRDGGGSLKALHRQILTSATYRQSSSPDAKGSRVDSDNRFLWRMNRRRLDAEAVRDAVLAAGGQLDLEMGGPSAEHFYFKDDHSPVYDYARFDVTSPAARRRSVYRFLVRSVQDPFMESLDCADPSLLVPRRNSTLTAVQALALLNDPLIVEQSRRFAGRLRSAGSNLASQIDDAVRIALGRAASEGEIAALASHARKHGLEHAVRLLLNSNEFIFVD